jgi:hypothetical protein
VAGSLVDPKASATERLKAARSAFGFYTRWFPQLAFGPGQLGGSYAEFGEPLAGHLRFVERSCRRLARNMFYGMARWQAKLERKQAFLGRVVDIGAELYAMTASCVRAKLLAADGPTENAGELADLFCRGARRRVEALFAALQSNDDVANYKAAQKALGGHYLWLESGILEPWAL